MKQPIAPIQEDQIFAISSEEEFNAIALKLFRYQAVHNPVYREYCNGLRISSDNVNNIQDIPFLPVEVFKNRTVIAANYSPELIFSSSGTEGRASKHLVAKKKIYDQSLLTAFRSYIGYPKEMSFLALLPGYIERPDSSLIYMVNRLMKMSGQKINQFYGVPNRQFYDDLEWNKSNGVKTIVFGVTFSLLELDLPKPELFEGVSIIETGGMKGLGKELTKVELLQTLNKKLNPEHIFGEYGMTEMLSQCYSRDGVNYKTPPWVKVLIREPNDPKAMMTTNSIGGINVIDLANIYSCCFLATQDLGRSKSQDTIEIMGRFDNSDIRGCNLLFT